MVPYLLTFDPKSSRDEVHVRHAEREGLVDPQPGTGKEEE
jgi:hypothetical protein